MFNSMHTMAAPLLICNVWDGASAQIAQRLGFLAIGTSSAAIAHSLGQQDGENISFDALLSQVQVIAQATQLPLTVDIESGYGDTAESIARNISALVQLGVVGINIEDSIMLQGQRKLRDSQLFANLLRQVTELLGNAGIDIFINVRSDTFLLNVEAPVAESIERIARYQLAGANGIFLPCIVQPDDIAAVVASTPLPVNVMCMPELPAFAELAQLGVKRISMGNFVHEAMLSALSSTLMAIKTEQSFQVLFA